jgi:peptidyl-prolyl cis-trans isomerase D
MLNTFRKGGVVQFVMGGVIFIIIAAFALDYRGRQHKTNFSKECVVDVGGTCVAPRDFTTAFSLSVRQDLTTKEIKRLGIRQMIIDGLVERQLLVDEARRLGISIGEPSVDAELSLGRVHYSMPAARDGQLPMVTYLPVHAPDSDAFNYDLYQRMVRNRARMSTKDFKVNQTEELIASRMRELIKSTVRVSDAEALDAFDQSRSRATVRVAQLNSNWFGRFTTPLSDAAVSAYAQTQSAEVDTAFATEESKYPAGCPLVSQIFFAFPAAADEKDEAETRARATRVAAQAAHASAEEFRILARIHGADPNAMFGGERGCLDAGEGEEAAQLAKAIEGLSPGGVSQLVESRRGFTLLRLDGHMPEDKDQLHDAARLAVARPLAARALADAATRDFGKALIAALGPGAVMQEAVDTLTKRALSESPVSTDARKLGGTALLVDFLAAARDSRQRPQVDVSPAFARVGLATPVYNIQRGTDAKQVAFSLKAVGDVYAEPLPTRDGVAVMQLKDREAARREDFDKEKGEFIRELKERAEAEALTQYVARLRHAREGQINVNSRFLEDKVRDDDS